jgi:hypothetical protein
VFGHPQSRSALFPGSGIAYTNVEKDNLEVEIEELISNFFESVFAGSRHDHKPASPLVNRNFIVEQTPLRRPS